jgi:type IV secretory pathway TraG/TraD family ATPase VirD4
MRARRVMQAKLPRTQVNMYPVTAFVLSILQTADEGLSFLSNKAISDVVRISSMHPEEMKHGERPTVVIVTMPVSMLRHCRNWFGLTVSTFLEVLNSSPRGRWGVLFEVDECGILPRQRLIEQAYAESRKRGVQLFCFFQHLGQFDIYGKNGKGINNFESGSEVALFMPPRDLDTARYISDRAGRGTAVVPQYSFSKGRNNRTERNLSFGEQAFDVLTPQQAMNLGRYSAVMFRGGKALLVGRRPYFDNTLPGHQRAEHAQLRHLIAADPYHKGKAV